MINPSAMPRDEAKEDLPYTVLEPARWPAPGVRLAAFGARLSRGQMMAATALDDRRIRRSEDAFVDDLIASAPSWARR